ncbi:proton-translocating NADH-quinone oxidoreductase, chain N [Thermodesulfatator indicus DSM 15286]|uniref:NADH-quinone oxidoreductase subunit N n=1 Tax=Thermodesulfatator indicus (strain DSM 15286 / JCM 11887 / CIR29812) TaxID=667014 RepID=F8AAX7_THEID|nr:NADH-quinone oxidoreductase subunit N [Thermodesulfatator indicus]AEH45495.1 proton-translocating NADH-quinone oxidoreductase, chain N [Thermodesulfatator indicus DSM 15286]
MWSSLPSFVAVYPEILLVVVASIMALIDRWVKLKDVFAWITVATSLLALIMVFAVEGAVFGNSYAADTYGLFFKMIFLLVLIMVTLLSPGYNRMVGIHFGEYYALLMFAVTGMMLMASSKDLILLFLGLELMSLSVYVLAGLLYSDLRSLEGAMKYFLLGAFSSAFLLLAITFLYGLTGTTYIDVIAKKVFYPGLADNTALLLSAALFAVAFGFKVALVPFHMWSPDAYEGAPTSVTAFMAVGPKAAGFAAMGRVFVEALYNARVDWVEFLVPLALVTMFVGAILSLVQTNIKRLLAYSSITNAGYAVLGIIAASQEGMAATMLYLLLYLFMTTGAFGVVTLFRQKDFLGEEIADYQGLSKTHPWVALVMLIFLFSLVGIPPTAGFIGKFFVFKAAYQAGHHLLVIGAVLASAIAAYPYLRIVMLMYMKEPEKDLAVNVTPYVFAGLLISVVGVLVLGVYPEPVINFARACCAGLIP